MACMKKIRVLLFVLGSLSLTACSNKSTQQEQSRNTVELKQVKEERLPKQAEIEILKKRYLTISNRSFEMAQQLLKDEKLRPRFMEEAQKLLTEIGPIFEVNNLQKTMGTDTYWKEGFYPLLSETWLDLHYVLGKDFHGRPYAFNPGGFMSFRLGALWEYQQAPTFLSGWKPLLYCKEQTTFNWGELTIFQKPSGEYNLKMTGSFTPYDFWKALDLKPNLYPNVDTLNLSFPAASCHFEKQGENRLLCNTKALTVTFEYQNELHKETKVVLAEVNLKVSGKPELSQNQYVQQLVVLEGKTSFKNPPGKIIMHVDECGYPAWQFLSHRPR